MKNKKEIIEVIILFIVLIGIVSYAASGFFGDNYSGNKSRTLLINHIAKEYNISNSEIIVTEISPITIEGQNFYNIQVSFYAQNKTFNKSYNVNTANGTINAA
ncbi:MAG: hypothetical protein LBU74_02610 [Methanobacteriaceae archaeon]|nr:hypothetical protein [Candidatus Methanorudis spinitermitis]